MALAQSLGLGVVIFVLPSAVTVLVWTLYNGKPAVDPDPGYNETCSTPEQALASWSLSEHSRGNPGPCPKPPKLPILFF